MPIKNREFYNRKAVMHGPYYVVHYASGGFNVWKRGWKTKKGLDVRNDERLIAAYQQQMREYGRIKESLQCQIAARAIPVCGRLSREVGRELLSLPAVPKQYSPTKKEARSVVREYWKPDETGEHPMKTPTDFKRANEKIYKYIARHCHGLKKVMESVYPKLYHQVAHRRAPPTHHNKGKIAAILLKRYAEGKSISPTYLRTSPDSDEKEYYRMVMDHQPEDFFDEAKTYTEIASRFIGLPERDIMLGRGAAKNASVLSEDLTKFLLAWGLLLGLQSCGFTKNDNLFTAGEALRFSHTDKDYIADLRINNAPVEVKSGVNHFSKKDLDELLEKYGNGGGVWKTGEHVEKGTVVFHRDLKSYRHATKEIEDAGLRIITYEGFHRELRELVDVMKADHLPLFSDVRPITDLDYLVSLHEEVSLHPFLLVREGNKYRRIWSKHILEALVERTQELKLAEQSGKQ